MNNRIGAIITGGDFQGLGAARTLAKKGIPVILLDHHLCIGRFSRYIKKLLKSPPISKTESYINFLVEIAHKEDLSGWVVFPNCDNSVYVLSKYKKELENYYRIPTPSWNVIKQVYIKKNTYELAEKNGIPIPKTYTPASVNDLINIDISFPLVVKPSIRDNFYSKYKTKAFLVKDKKELEKLYTWICSVIDPTEVLIQEFIGGKSRGLYSFCPFFKNNEVIASITAKRLRQHPMDFGHASTFAELVNIPEIQSSAKKLLTLIGYYGIGEVEFMYDPKDHQYKLIELNPRIWGWHTLAIAAGVDLPYLLYLDMIGESYISSKAVENLKWVRLITDVPTVFNEIRKGNMTFRDYITSMSGNKEFAVLSKDDPLPFFAELFMLPYLWIKKGF